ncbi:MAG: ABC transporter ATP-binding protein [Anaerolineaceae bacterium]|nr:ABC transporter ATP-binding protein [Anaerolineaceae bacterium]
MKQINNHQKANNKPAMIEIVGVTKIFDVGDTFITALDNICLSIDFGEFVSVVGRSGSGKSTLMNMITGIDHPSSGQIIVKGTHTHGLPENEMAVWRGKNLGIVFQFNQLLPTLSLLDNVMLPIQLVSNKIQDHQKDRALELLQAVNLWKKKDQYPAQLSGGEQQRAAIARAIANDPPILIADEPTGNLSSSETQQVMDIFKSMVDAGKTIIFVTHDPELAEKAERKITLSDGKVIKDSLLAVNRRKSSRPRKRGKNG